MKIGTNTDLMAYLHFGHRNCQWP